MPRLTKEEVQEKISRYIDQALQGIPNEEPKLDYKRQYHNLKDNKSKSKFLKLVTAIANTLGEHGFIVYGFDPDDTKKQFFYPPKLSDSGLKDDNELTGFIVRNVSHSFDIIRYPIDYKGNLLEVLYIPATNEKPYLVRSMHDAKGNIQRNQIFVRDGTTTKNANKGDIDDMYYYRGKEQNIIPDYDLELSIININEKSVYEKTPQNLRSIELMIENIGKRPFSISKVELITEKKGAIPFDDPVKEMKGQEITTSKIRKIIFYKSELKLFKLTATSNTYKVAELVESNSVLKTYFSNGLELSKSFDEISFSTTANLKKVKRSRNTFIKYAPNEIKNKFR